MRRCNILTLILLFCINACTPSLPYNIIGNTQESATVSACSSLLESVDELINRHHLKDFQYYSIPGFPYLRSNRFWSSFDLFALTQTQLNELLSHLNRLDRNSRKIEVKKLLAMKTRLANSAIQVDDSLLEAVNNCSLKMSQNLPKSKEILSLLNKKLTIPDDYIAWRQALGIYPVSRHLLSLGVSRSNRKISRDFQKDLHYLDKEGTIVRYRPIDNISHVSPEPIKTNSLGVPVLSDHDLSKLFLYHAPILEIDMLDDSDKIGKIVGERKKIKVSVNQATAYTFVSFTRFNKQILVQLNYVFWFPKRRPKKLIDIYAGKVDGITWRVTLNPEGQALIFDTIHNCGCYYMAFPTEQLRARPSLYDEKLLVPQFAPTTHAHETRIVLRISSGNHYLQRVYAGTVENDSAFYYFADYDKLRSLRISAKQFGIFNRYGLIPGTNRLEQFLLWPAGIRSPGAMRQRGHQPISFLNKIHFDDANLIETFFVIKP